MLAAGGAVLAQSAPAAFVIEDVPLTAALIEGFLAVENELDRVIDESQGAGSAKIHAEIERAAQRHGFRDFAHYDRVAATIIQILNGLDRATKVFTDVPASIRNRMETVRTDATMDAATKRQVLAELDIALKEARPLRYPDSVPLVVKYFDRIEAALNSHKLRRTGN